MKHRYATGGILSVNTQHPLEIRHGSEHLLPRSEAERVSAHVMRAMLDAERKRRILAAETRRVRRGDVLIVRGERLTICRVDTKNVYGYILEPGSREVYVCTNGAKTIFVTEDEIVHHQHHWRYSGNALHLVEDLADLARHS